MRIYKPEDWMNKKLDTSIIQNEVKKNASEIRTRRIGKAKELEASSVKIAQEKQSISSLLEQAQETLSNLTVSSQNKEALNRLIAELENAYSQYEYITRNLAKRFQNAKIRVIAFGPKSQGKSSFIKSFTKLPDEIVPTKPMVIKTKQAQHVFTYTNKVYLLTIPKYMSYFVDLKRFYQ